MAEANGRAFLNNASLGIYEEAVRSPAYRDAKVRTLLETAAEVMGPSAEAPALYLIDDSGREHRDLIIVLVSNNPYAPDRPLARGARPQPVHAGVDGEAVELSPPLQFAIRPATLRVRISPRHPGASPSARLRLPGHPPRSQPGD